MDPMGMVSIASEEVPVVWVPRIQVTVVSNNPAFMYPPNHRAPKHQF